MSEARKAAQAAMEAARSGDMERAKALAGLANKIKARETGKPITQQAAPAQSMPTEAPTKQVQPSLEGRAKETFGFKDYATRGTILPMGRTKEGDLEFAMPQIGVDMLQSAMLPGHAAQGGAYTAQDVAKFALDYGAPATSRSGMAPKPKAQTPKEWAKSAPTSKRLAERSNELYEVGEQSGVRIPEKSYSDFLGGMQSKLVREGFDEDINPTVAGVMKALGKREGQDLDMQQLEIARKQIQAAVGSPDPSTRRLGYIMRDHLDDYFENDIPDAMPEARKLWARRRKSEEIEKALDKASRKASGFENGVRIELRKILDNEKRARAYSKEERDAMQQIVDGTSGQKFLRLLAKLSYARSDAGNLFGGTMGSATGAAIGASLFGPAGAYVGAAVPPAIGYAGQKASVRSVKNQADLLRALAAYGKGAPKQGMEDSMRVNLIARGVGPLLATGALGSQGGANRPDVESEEARRKRSLEWLAAGGI